jgi:hypothetical protein
LIFSGDNGRVLGYDNAHGEHHRHYRGEVEAVDLPGYEAALEAVPGRVAGDREAAEGRALTGS